jgi:hypothetical protein
MVNVFFEIRGIVHKEFVLAGQTVNSACYSELLRQLHEYVRRLCSKLWRQKNWLLHQDSAPSHSSFFIREFLTKNSMTVIPHLPYFSLPRFKIELKGHHYDTIEVIEAE